MKVSTCNTSLLFHYTLDRWPIKKNMIEKSDKDLKFYNFSLENKITNIPFSLGVYETITIHCPNDDISCRFHNPNGTVGMYIEFVANNIWSNNPTIG
jgi:hypothetical protein